MGSLPFKMAEWISTSVNVDLLKIYYWSNGKLEPTFCMQDFYLEIAQVKYRDQTRCNRFFDSKPLINNIIALES